MNTITSKDSIVAIRSLQSEHHAINIEPSVVFVEWMLGKRCNNDCSYCTPHYHDNVSPHISMDRVKQTVKVINQQLSINNKTAYYAISGGEPFLHPNIFEILNIIANSSAYGGKLSIITNGSLPLRVYKKSMQFITNFTVSIHLELQEKEIEKVINRAIELKKMFPEKFFTAHIMFIPGSKDRAFGIKSRLNSAGIKAVIRRIRPNSSGHQEEQPIVIMPMSRKKDRSLATLPIDDQSNRSIGYQTWKDSFQQSWIEKYYGQEDLEFLSENTPVPDYNNIGVWTADGKYAESHTDYIISQNHNHFLGWHCYSGIDFLYINFAGEIFNAECQRKRIGCIDDNFTLPVDPVVCPMKTCISLPDVMVRKSMPEFLHLITKSDQANP